MHDIAETIGENFALYQIWKEQLDPSSADPVRIKCIDLFVGVYHSSLAFWIEKPSLVSDGNFVIRLVFVIEIFSVELLANHLNHHSKWIYLCLRLIWSQLTKAALELVVWREPLLLINLSCDITVAD